MTFHAITAIVDAEMKAAQLKAAGEEKGKALLQRMHQEGKELLASIAALAEEERKQLIDQAEQKGQKQTESIAAAAEAHAATLRQTASLRQDEAVAKIIESIVVY